MEVRQSMATSAGCWPCPPPARLRRALAIFARRKRIPLPLRHPLDVEVLPGPSLSFSCEGRSHHRPLFARRIPKPACSAATRTGAGPSGFRSIICCWKPWNAIITFMATVFRSSCRPASGQQLSLDQVADELGSRLLKLFLPDAQGRRPCFGQEMIWTDDPHWAKLLLFHEFFHGDTGAGLGANHQTGWTALVARLLEDRASRAPGRNIPRALLRFRPPQRLPPKAVAAARSGQPRSIGESPLRGCAALRAADKRLTEH